jgi:lysophospholipase L1-like esterase
MVALCCFAGCAQIVGPEYQAFGDSITFGASLENPGIQAYPALVAAFEHVTFANRAIGGDEACDITARQIFPAEVGRTVSFARPIYSVLIGTNDVNVKGVGPYESVFMLCHQALITWLGVPLEHKVLSGGNGMATKGPGSADLSHHWNAWMTRGLGSSISFTIRTTQSGPIYAWPLIDDDNPSTYTYSLDGVLLGSANTQTEPKIATQNRTTRSMALLRFPAVPTGSHQVTFTQTSPGALGVAVVGVGAPAAPDDPNRPTVLIGTVPFQMRDGEKKYCYSSDLPCLAYIADIEADVKLLAEDGVDVRLFDTRRFMFGMPDEMYDGLHPNALGHLELSHSVEASWPTPVN